MNLKNLLLLPSFFLIFSCQETVENRTTENSFSSRIDSYIREVMTIDDIPGLAVAVIQDSALLHKGYYGYANLENRVSVSDSSVFRLYSLTKFMTAVATLRLVQDNKLSLQDVISKHIDGLPESWEQIKIEHLLTHSSGLPEYKDFDQSLSDLDILEELKKASLRFPKGERYEYNQTGYWLLKQIIENITEEAFENVVLDLQFSNAGDEAFFASNSLAVYPNRNAKYIYNHQLKRYEHSTFSAGSRSIAGNGLNTNLNQLIAWNKLFNSGKLLNADTKEILLKPFTYTNDDKPFLHGIDGYSINKHNIYGFSGGAVVDFKKFDTGLTIIILTNGFKYRPRIANMMRYIAGIADSRLKAPHRVAQEQLRIDVMKSASSKEFSKVCEEAQKEHPETSFEGVLNSIGYDFILVNELEKAIEIFQINTDKHPNSFNVFDSLGEAHMLNHNIELAIKNYKKSLELNPNNNNAIQMIKKMNKNN